MARVSDNCPKQLDIRAYMLKVSAFIPNAM